MQSIISFCRSLKHESRMTVDGLGYFSLDDLALDQQNLEDDCWLEFTTVNIKGRIIAYVWGEGGILQEEEGMYRLKKL